MKNPGPTLLLIVVIGLLVGGILFYGAIRRSTVPYGQTTAETTTVPDGAPAEEGEAHVSARGIYQDYEPALLANADMGKVVLFFKAGWCITCAALDRDIVANIDRLPENVTILKVDYDNSPELRAKYNVKVQHSLVQVDEEGNEIKQWQGSLKLEQFLSEIV